MMVVIITNKDITALKTKKEYEELRFYIIYIADYAYRRDGYNWYVIDPKIINIVLESNEFKEYMERK